VAICLSWCFCPGSLALRQPLSSKMTLRPEVQKKTLSMIFSVCRLIAERDRSSVTTRAIQNSHSVSQPKLVTGTTAKREVQRPGSRFAHCLECRSPPVRRGTLMVVASSMLDGDSLGLVPSARPASNEATEADLPHRHTRRERRHPSPGASYRCRSGRPRFPQLSLDPESCF
jgi:hypothetical protein